MQDDVERTIEKILGETDTDPDTLRKRVLASPPAARAAIVDRLHDEPAGRRWLRLLLPFLDEAERQTSNSVARI